MTISIPERRLLYMEDLGVGWVLKSPEYFKTGRLLV